MAKKTEAQTTGDDQVDTDEGMGEFEEDGTADVLRKFLEDDDGPSDDDGGLDQPFTGEDEDDLDVVSPDKGQGMVEDATLKRERAKAAEKKGEPKADKADADDNAEDKSQGEKPGDKATEKKSDDASDLASAPVADLVKDVPEAQRAELTRRLGEAEKLNALFAGREEEMKMHGLSGPSEVVSRLLHLNAYAQQNPAEYIAWVARETGGDKAHEALSAAAQQLGYKLVQDAGDDDDDPFMTDREREMAAEIKRMKAGQAPQNRGPMAPEQIAQQQALQVITQLKTELDPATGQQKRPYWGNVEHLIAQRATQHRSQTNAAPTAADLARFYDEVVAELQQQFGGGGNSAAQPQAGMAQQAGTNAAAQPSRSKAASKMIDGTGQGASRRPALSDDASIEDVIRHAMAQQEQ